ncbi:GNAT family N-acetyltransferase [Priestia megaterium]|uniref:GNAT family N-acetyltransferase n=1 Tax=Priestia megaterium TaxID=1404 RepID=UPI0035CC7B88
MVEKAVLENVQDLVSLRILLMKELGELNGNEELFRKATEEYFTANINNPHSYTAILKANGEIVSAGSIVFFIRPPSPSNLQGKEAYVINMYTAFDHRKHGYSSAILKHLMQYCQKNGVNRIWLNASSAGKSLYQKHGFIEYESEMEYKFEKN